MDYQAYSMLDPIEELDKHFESLAKTMFILVKKFHDLGFTSAQSYIVAFSFGARVATEAARMYMDLFQIKINKLHCEYWLGLFHT